MKKLWQNIESCGGTQALLESAVPEKYRLPPFSSKRLNYLSNFIQQRIDILSRIEPFAEQKTQKTQKKYDEDYVYKLEKLVNYVADELFDPAYFDCDETHFESDEPEKNNIAQAETHFDILL